jgi:hypothetical protein
MPSSSGKGKRHFFGLYRDLGKTGEKLNRTKESQHDFEYEPIRPDYSKTTPELVYTFVAGHLVRQGDVSSFVRRAGLDWPESRRLRVFFLGCRTGRHVYAATT